MPSGPNRDWLVTRNAGQALHQTRVERRRRRFVLFMIEIEAVCPAQAVRRLIEKR